jgi:hypothetical protein
MLSARVEIVEEVSIEQLMEEKVIKPSQEIFIDQGLPIPMEYDIDTIHALLQDPFHIWVYWSVKEATIKRLVQVFPALLLSSFRLVLKISELKLNHITFIEIENQGNYWLNVFPDRHYLIEIGLHSFQRGYIRLLQADEILTPRGTISMQVAEQAEYQVSSQQFAEVLEVSGFASFTGVLAAPEVVNMLPPAVADVVTTISTGTELSEQQLASLPPRIRALILRLRAEGGDWLAALGLLHLLPEYLRESIHISDEEMVIDTLHPDHLTPRFMVGSSQSFLPPRPQPWLPSMPARTMHSLLTKPSIAE